MSEMNEAVVALLGIVFVVLFAIGLVALCLLFTRWTKRLFYRSQGTEEVMNILSNGNLLQVQVVRNANECQNAMRNIRTHCVDYNVVGIHSISSTSRVPDLIVLATHRGLCVIIRLCFFKKTLPLELKRLLEDENIIKVGMYPYQFISQPLFCVYDLEAKSTYDIRFLSNMCNYPRSDLYLQFNEFRIDPSNINWRAKILTTEKKVFAAKYAFRFLELFKKFVELIKPNTVFFKNDVQQFIYDYRLFQQFDDDDTNFE